MKQQVRLVSYGYLGAPFPPPYSLNYNAAALWQGAESQGGGAPDGAAAGGAHNLVLVAAPGGRSASAPGVGAGPMAEAQALHFLRLSHRRFFETEHNQWHNWHETSGGGHLRPLLSNPFGGAVSALEHSDGRAHVASRYVSQGLPLGANRPFCLNGYCYSPEPGQGFHLWQVRCGQFCFQLRNFRAEALWLAPTWSLPLEAELHGLWALATLSGPQRARRDELVGLLYLAIKPLALGGAEYFENQRFCLDFMPEPLAGRIGVEAGNGLRATLQVPREAQSTLGPGPDLDSPLMLWNEGRLHLSCLGGAYFWQVGFPDFARGGEVALVAHLPVQRLELGPLFWALNREAPEGTGVAVEQRSGPNVYQVELALQLSSAAGEQSPLLYGVAFHFEGGAPTGDDAVAWDSNQHTLPELGGRGGLGPVLEARAVFGEDGRCTWEVVLPLLAGELLADLPGYNYPYLEDRVVSLWIGETAVLTRGLVTAARVLDMAGLRPNLPRLQVEPAHATLHLTVADGWAICRETKLTSPPVGDGLHLAAYARRLLRTCGFYAWQVAHLPASGGALIKGAAIGQEWAELPAQFASVAAVLQGLEAKYGLGQRFVYGADGCWRLERPPTQPLLVLDGAVVPHPHTAEGRASVLRPLDLDRGGQEAYNAFVVLGARGPNGRRLSASYYDRVARFASGSGSVLNFRGRWRLCPPLVDPALRSQAACDVALRSLRALYPASGRTAQFETYFRPDLRPGQLLNIEGRFCRVQRAVGSWAQDSMHLLVREES